MLIKQVLVVATALLTSSAAQAQKAGDLVANLETVS